MDSGGESWEEGLSAESLRVLGVEWGTPDYLVESVWLHTDREAGKSEATACGAPTTRPVPKRLLSTTQEGTSLSPPSIPG